MLHHILVKWTDTVTDKASLAAKVEALFQGVLTVEGVHGVTIHPNVINRPNRYDLLIRNPMEESALPAYDNCETHHRWKDEYGHLVAKRPSLTAIDPDGLPTSRQSFLFQKKGLTLP